MKPCEQVLLYVQQELNATERAAFEAHIKTCEACRKEVAFLQKLDEGWTVPAAPQRVVDKLFARTTRKKPMWARWKVAWTAAAAGAVFAGIFALSMFTPRPAFDAQELVAYMNSQAESEYAAFASELADMEDYF